ncbi:MAG: MarR family transcriptional regulator, partial [Pyrinomonadaceae bacterium]|nr:MarR family transcriptional regulator [Pyrinomonadaceae bacterium]
MEFDVNRVLSRLTVAHRKANEEAMCEIGLHSGQVQILASLWEKDGQSQADLVRDLCVSPPTVNKMVARLSDANFVSTKKCPEDKRLMRVY